MLVFGRFLKLRRASETCREFIKKFNPAQATALQNRTDNQILPHGTR